MSQRALALTVVCLAACSPSEPSRPTFVVYEPPTGSAARIAYDADLTRHLGGVRPSETATDADGDITYTFDPATGAMCMRGAPFRMSVRESATSDDLLIFLQGGGACWSDFCLAITAAPPGIPGTDLLRDGPDNPVAGWDVVYVPYCDGSLFAGDNEIDEDGDGTPDRLHHGLANLSAALAMGYSHFPSPARVVLAGSSGGGFGTILAAFLVRYVYPDARIYVLNDAGIGVARPEEPAFVETLIDEFGAREFLPADCPDCVSDGNITGLVDYLLDRDSNVRVAAISSRRDYVISEVFLRVDPAAFESALVSETAALHDEHPGAYRRFLYAGDAHTALLGNVTGIVGSDIRNVELPPDTSGLLSRLVIESMHVVTIDEHRLDAWLRAMIADDDTAWPDLVSPATTP